MTRCRCDHPHGDGGILKETDNLLYLYLHHVGVSEPHMDLHFWCCMAAVAACVSNRVGYEKTLGSGRLLPPSLYTFLIADSATGKGTAINDTLCPLLGEENVPGLNYFSGNTTAERLMEMLSNVKKRKDGSKVVDPEKARLFLIMEELGSCIYNQPGPFIRFLTGQYRSDGHLPWRKETVAGAQASIKNMSLNWLAGSTQEWLASTIPPDVIEGGFLGRVACLCIPPEWRPERMIAEPAVPTDFQAVRARIIERFQELTTLNGQFHITKKAKAFLARWYENRKWPKDNKIVAAWRRQHDLVIKLSQIFSLCESTEMLIRLRHVTAAIKSAQASLEHAYRMNAAVSVTHDTRNIVTLRGVIRRYETMTEGEFYKAAESHGIGPVNAKATMDALYKQRQVSIRKKGMNLYYVWKGEEA